MRKIRFVLLLTAASMAVLSACGSSQTIKTPSGNVTVSENGNSFVAESNNGGKTEVSQGKTLPDTFPKEVPIPDKSTIDGSVQSTKDGTSTIMITLTTDMSASEVSQLYSSFMKDKGYQNTTETVADTVSINSGTLNKFTLQVMTETDTESGKTSAVITWIDETNKKE